MTKDIKHVGKCIQLKENDYNYNLQMLGYLVEPIKEIVTRYQELPLPKTSINQDFLNDIDNNGINTIRQAFVEYGESEISRMGIKISGIIDTYRAQVLKDLGPLESAIKRLQARQHEISSSGNAIYKANLIYFDIVNGEPIVSKSGKEALKKEFSVFIEDEDQAVLWEQFLELKRAFDTVSKTLQGLGHRIHHSLYPIIGPSGSAWQAEDNTLHIETDLFPHYHRLRTGFYEKMEKERQERRERTEQTAKARRQQMARETK